MPTLSSTPLSSRNLELPDSTDVVLQSVQLLTDRINEACVEPARQISERINEVYLEPWRQLSESIRRMMEVQNKLMIQALAVELAFNKLFPNGLFNFPPSTFKAANIFGTANIIEGEIEEAKETPLGSEVLETALIPRPTLIPVPTVLLPATRTRSKMGLKEVAGRSFTHLRKVLRKLSHRNCEGRLLSLFLANDYLFANDEDIYDKLHMPVGRSFSWVLRNLKRKFRENGLVIDIERRWDPDGYIIVDIRYLQ